MAIVRRVTLALTVLLLGFASTPLHAVSSKVTDLLKQAERLPQQAPALLKETKQYQSSADRTPAGDVVARCLETLALLHLRQNDQARTLLEAMYEDRGQSASSEAGRLWARYWLTLMDRQVVERVLRSYYSEHVRYPDSLNQLTRSSDQAFPMQDRWGDRWEYTLVQPRFFSRTEGQLFRLSSQNTDVDSLERALKQPFAANLKSFEAGEVISRQPRVISFRDKESGRSYTLSEGTDGGGLLFIALDNNQVLLSNGSSFIILTYNR